MVNCVSQAHRKYKEAEDKRKLEEELNKQKEVEAEAERKAKEEYESKIRSWDSKIYDNDLEVYQVRFLYDRK